ncbi:hypothetical protein N0V85_008493 [Neurospora sp. IMI 360204]|nr:hypothetical protein N0V85_008493 [Neurospora sp. IMI 360204]
MANEQEILEASSILTSMASSAVDRLQTPVNDTTSPNIAAPVPAQTRSITTLWHPRGRLPFQFAKALSANQLNFINHVAIELIGEARSLSDLHELRVDAITSWGAYESCAPEIFKDEVVVKKKILCYEVIEQVDGTFCSRRRFVFEVPLADRHVAKPSFAT